MFDAWQKNLEHRAELRLAVDEDRAAVLFDDAVHRCEPEPRALAKLFGRIERFEQTFSSRIVHPYAGVADGEHDVLADCRARMSGYVRPVEFHIGRLDQQGAAARHRVSGIERKVQNDLFDLSRVGADPVERCLRPPLEPYVVADQSP